MKECDIFCLEITVSDKLFDLIGGCTPPNRPEIFRSQRFSKICVKPIESFLFEAINHNQALKGDQKIAADQWVGGTRTLYAEIDGKKQDILTVYFDFYDHAAQTIQDMLRAVPDPKHYETWLFHLAKNYARDLKPGMSSERKVGAQKDVKKTGYFVGSILTGIKNFG